jgi:hypothetical protein
VLYTPRIGARFRTCADHPAVIVQEACPWSQTLPAVWRSWASRAAKQDNLDIYHGLSTNFPCSVSRRRRGPWSPCTTCFSDHPHLYPWLDRHVYTLKYRASCRHADLVEAISQKTAEEARDLFGIPETASASPTKAAIPPFTRLSTSEKKSPAREVQLSECFVLFVGSLVARKG